MLSMIKQLCEIMLYFTIVCELNAVMKTGTKLSVIALKWLSIIGYIKRINDQT
jgi:TRAP-type C4-dicarboxylate transport system permease large subunit